MSKIIKIIAKTEHGLNIASAITNYTIEDTEDAKTINVIFDKEKLLDILAHQVHVETTYNIIESKPYSNPFKIDSAPEAQTLSPDTQVSVDAQSQSFPKVTVLNEKQTIDPRFIFVVDQKIIELIAIPNEESDLNNFKNKYKINAETWVKIKEIKNEFNNEKINLEKEKPNCPSCEIGALNRKYITKLLPYLENEIGNKFLEDLKTIFLQYNQGVNIESLSLNFSETKSLLKQMDEELKNQTKDGKTCSTCAMNSLKNKYLQLARSMYHMKISKLITFK